MSLVNRAKLGNTSNFITRGLRPTEKWNSGEHWTCLPPRKTVCSVANDTGQINQWPATFVGRDISVGIATRYGLDGPGIESRWGARFSATVQTGPGAHPASYTMGTGSFAGVKRPWRGVDHPPHLVSRLKKEYSLPLLPLWAFVAYSRVNFNFTVLYPQPST